MPITEPERFPHLNSVERAINPDRTETTPVLPALHSLLANRQLGTIEKIAATGNAEIRLDSGRAITVNFREDRNLDYGYAVTSHSSQGQTADRVLIHVDTEQAGEKLVNQRLAYVSVSRGRYDAQIYTNDKAHLAEQLGRDVSHRSAIEPGHDQQPAETIESPAPSHAQAVAAHGQGIEL